MKKVLFALGLCSLLFPVVVVFAGTDITYNRETFPNESVVAGNIYFQGAGWVKANRVCFDSQTSVYKTTVTSYHAVRCSIPTLPVWKCEEQKGQLIHETVPTKDYIAPLMIKTQDCLQFDYSVPTQPRCVQFQNVEKEQPVDFEFLKYKVELSRGHNEAKAYEVRDVVECQ